MKKTLINRIKHIMMKMMITCKEASFLIDKSQYTDLSFKEKFNLKLHLFTCKFCRLYNVESKLINEKIQKIYKIKEYNYKLSDEQKQRIIEKLKN